MSTVENGNNETNNVIKELLFVPEASDLEVKVRFLEGILVEGFEILSFYEICKDKDPTPV